MRLMVSITTTDILGKGVRECVVEGDTYQFPLLWKIW